MGNTVLIKHIVAIWDECDHVSKKHSARLSEIFWKGYLSVFPDGAGTSESPMVLVTDSQMFAMTKVSKFFHNGEYLEYKGKNKDLAILKYCSSGFIDQNEQHHFVLDDLRALRFRKGDPPMHANESIMVVFYTSDKAQGMQGAAGAATSSGTRGNFAIIFTDKINSKGDKRMHHAGAVLGQVLKNRFIEIKDGGLVLDKA